MPRPAELLLGRIALERGLLTAAQLDETIAAQERGIPRPPLGVLLVERGLLTPAQVDDLLSAQADTFAREDPSWEPQRKAWRFGALAIRLGLAAPEPVNRALREQALLQEDRLLGGILVAQGAMTEAQVAEVLRAQAQDTPGRATRTLDGSEPTPDANRGDAAGAVRRGFGKYELLEELGRGGMGVVYRAFDRELRREVALKTLQFGNEGNLEAVARLLREARTAGALEHPGIVPIHDVGTIEGVPYLAMAYVRGRTLQAALAEGAGVALRARVGWVFQAAEAVAHAHGRGVVHRDLKPSNVMIEEGAGRVVVLDFGLARRLNEGTRLTWTGEVLGTPAFMAPEQVEGEADRIGPATDVWALGALLYEALTGRAAFAGATIEETMFKILSREPEPPRRKDARIARDLETVCLRCLEKEPGRRYAHAGPLAADLERFLAGEEIAARPVGWVERQWKRAKRNRGVATLAAGLALVLAVAAAWGGAEGIRRWRLAGFAEETDALLAAGRQAEGMDDRVAAARFTEARQSAVRAVALSPDARYEALADRAQAGIDGSEAYVHLAAGNWGDAAKSARRAIDLAPEVGRYKDLLNRALAGEKRTEGAQCFAAWRAGVQRTMALETAEKQAEKDAETAQPAQRPGIQERRWNITKELRKASPKREDDWSQAVSRFTEATTYWREDEEARQVLAELYWYRFRKAEVERDRTNEQTFARLVQDVGGAKYGDLVRCERPVRVRFELPQGFAAGTVVAYLYAYEQKDAPPILVPVPCDRATGKPFDADDLLAKDLAFGRPVPLALATAPPAVGGPAALLPAGEMAERERQADAHVAAGRYAAALPLLDLLTRAAPAAPGHAYNLACCFAVGAREQDPAAWLAAGADAAEVKELAQRWKGMGGVGSGASTLPPPLTPDPSTWRALALLALEESVCRGWRDAAHTETDVDLAALRPDPGFARLLAVMRGGLPARHVCVLDVVAASQAAKLGAHPGDVLLSVGGEPSSPTPHPSSLETPEQVSSAISAAPAGQEYRVVLWRGGERVTVTATGGGPLGVRMVQADLRPESATRFPWTSAQPAAALPVAPEVERARWSELHHLRQRDGNRVALAVVREGGARPQADLALSLPRGSYLLYVPAGQGLYETRYPFEVARDLDWDERCQLPAADDVPPPLPAAPQPPDAGKAAGYWVYVPAGPYRAGGDRDAPQYPARDAAILRVARGDGVAIEQARQGALPAEGFYLARFEVTSAMYLEFLNDGAWHEGKRKVPFARAPRQAVQATKDAAYWQQGPDGRVALPAGMAWWTGDVPVMGISWDDATDFCAWLTRRAGGERWVFALPVEDEWEKAARGPDGRSFAWGDDFDGSFCRGTEESRAGEQEKEQQALPEPLGLFPLDRSVYGVRDVAGGMREWTSTVSDARGEYRVLKGGAWGVSSAFCRCASRAGSDPWHVSVSNGLRVLARRTR